MPAEVDGNVDNLGSNGAVGNNAAGNNQQRRRRQVCFLDLDSEYDGTMNAAMSPGCYARDRSAVGNQQHKSNVNKVSRPRQLEGKPPSPLLDDNGHDAKEVEVVALGSLLHLLA